MAMGKRRWRRRQERLWVGHQELAKGRAHPFYVSCGPHGPETAFQEIGASGISAIIREQRRTLG